MGDMNSTSRNLKFYVHLALSWSHSGVLYRVTPWPEVRFERRYGDEWIPTSPAEDVLASAAQALGPLDWRPYLEFVPAGARSFLAQFTFARMEALRVVARCPALLPELVETLARDLVPLGINMSKPPSRPPDARVARALKWLLPKVLPFIARRAARTENRYSEVTTPLLMEYFAKPFVQAKARRLEENGR